MGRIKQGGSSKSERPTPVLAGSERLPPEEIAQYPFPKSVRQYVVPETFNPYGSVKGTTATFKDGVVFYTKNSSTSNQDQPTSSLTTVLQQDKGRGTSIAGESNPPEICRSCGLKTAKAASALSMHCGCKKKNHNASHPIYRSQQNHYGEDKGIANREPSQPVHQLIVNSIRLPTTAGLALNACHTWQKIAPSETETGDGWIQFSFPQCRHSMMLKKMGDGISFDVNCPVCLQGYTLIGTVTGFPKVLTVLGRVMEDGSPGQSSPEETRQDFGECELCYAVLNSDDIHLLQFLPCPDHVHCQKCLNQHLEACLIYNKPFICPGTNCKVKFKDDDWDVITGDIRFRRRTYNKQIQQAIASHAEEFFNCPGRNCNIVAIRPKVPENGVVEEQCPECSTKVVFFYKEGCEYGQLNDQKTDDDYQSYQRIKNEIAEGKVKLCPQCTKPIQYTTGCQHITCQCGFEFCWVCMHTWTSTFTRNGHLRHRQCNIATGETPYEIRRVEMPPFSTERHPFSTERHPLQEQSWPCRIL